MPASAILLRACPRLHPTLLLCPIDNIQQHHSPRILYQVFDSFAEHPLSNTFDSEVLSRSTTSHHPCGSSVRNMSTIEKRQPEPNAKPAEVPRLLVHTVTLISLTCSTALVLSLTRINSDDSFQEGILKLVPPFGISILIQAVVLYVSILRAIWTGRYPDARPTQSLLQSIATNLSNTAHLQMGWRYVAGAFVGAMWALGGHHSLWWALRYVRDAGERRRPLTAESTAEKGHAATAESTAEECHTSTTESTTEHSHRHSSTLPRLTIALMLIFSSAGFFDLATAIYSETIETALAFFGPCFLAALLVTSLMLHVALSLPRVLHGSNSQYLVSAYRNGGLIVSPCTCTALGFASWYYKGLPLDPGVYAAGHWATALYVGVGEILEQSSSSP